jgi:clorobiocin biosynthesis protein CloN6
MRVDDASPSPGLSTVSADLVLLHPPAVYDFRRHDIYFPFLGTTGDVPITPLYEFFPLGFKSLQRYLGARGWDVKIANLGTLLVQHRAIELRSVIEALDVRLVGIDLHWLVHAQGGLAVAEEIRRLRPELPIVFGGISANYFARELIALPYVDMVMRGYDTLEPVSRLLGALRDGSDLASVPNLLWKSGGVVHDNGVSHLPSAYGGGIDWRVFPRDEGDDARSALSIREIVANHTCGCSNDCGWCGGSRESFRRLYGSTRSLVEKSSEEISAEVASMSRASGVEQFHLYGSGTYNLDGGRLGSLLESIGGASIKSVNYEQHQLTDADVLARMASANDHTTITLSPQSHDPCVARLAGRGAYTNEELEAWIDRALEAGIHRVDLWFFAGMPEQDERSVLETVGYCEHLLRKFHGRRVSPMICPMMPLLDPASTFFEAPQEHGYRVFHRTLEQHRAAAQRASLVNRMNYETRWMSREVIVRIGFEAVKRLMNAKADAGLFPRQRLERFTARIDDALQFMAVVHEADCVPDPAARRRALAELSTEIARRNELVLGGYVTDQMFPIQRPIGGRWCDELPWSQAQLRRSAPLATCTR